MKYFIFLSFLVGSLSTFAGTPQPKDEWCSGNLLFNIKLSGPNQPQPTFDANEAGGFYLCINFQAGVAFIQQESKKSLMWHGTIHHDKNYGGPIQRAMPKLMKMETLHDGLVAYMFRLEPIVQQGLLVLPYRAGVGLIYDPVKKSFTDSAYFLVDSEDFYEAVDPTNPAQGYSNQTQGAKSQRVFDGENYKVIRLVKERNSN